MKTKSDKIFFTINVLMAIVVASKHGFNFFSILGGLFGMYLIPLGVYGVACIFSKNHQGDYVHGVATVIGALSLFGQFYTV